MRKALFTILACSLLMNTASAQTFFSNRPMHLLDHVDPFSGAIPTAADSQILFPARGVEIINGLYRGVNPQDDNARRERIKVTCEQFRFELGARWGGKRRAPNGPVSPDSIAYNEPDGTLSVWDIQTSGGDITVFENKPPDYPNLSPSEAGFVVCDAVDHLGAVVVPPPPVEPVPPVVVDNGPILAKLDDLALKVEGVRQSLEEHRLEARKTKSAVMGFLSDWKNYAKIASGVLGAWGISNMGGAQ